MNDVWNLSDNRKFAPEDLRAIMDRLLGPDGCPWDKVQTHRSIRKNLIEEAYETVDAIDIGDPDRVKDELGDVLLQVYFHSAMAEREGTFSLDDVADNICRKLISRHSHVFGTDSADSPEAVLSVWEKNKMAEKNQNNFSQTLADVPTGLPALMRSEKLQKRAAKAGFDWPDALGAREKIDEELSEIEYELIRDGSLSYSKVDAGDEPERYDRLESETGDLLFAVVNYARLLGVDPEVALNRANERFLRRFSKMEAAAEKRGVRLDTLALAEMDHLWDEVKKKGDVDEDR
ncbi:MAG: nucleoside triphosphate pyrophosphohydrolase [Oscillospiraceae bacterium]|nr:nucleoside triphosphate pyrophosphohydrolase [Oscillospiraceae bacterium]